jgi:hypothetical protein
MSAQGATLGGRRIGLHLPIWPVAILVTAVAAAAIGMTLLREQEQPRSVTSVSDVERFANSSAAVREQGATLPTVVGVSNVVPSSSGFAGFENPGAYITQAPTYAGFENPGAYVASASTYTPGLENPGAYPAGSIDEAGGTTGNPCPESCQLARR